MQPEEIIALDVGDKRIGVARANSLAKLPEPLTTVIVDGTEIAKIAEIAEGLGVSKVVVGLPRNQSGEETEQTQKVKNFANKLSNFEVIWQDESVTSINAEELLKRNGKSFDKGDIDALAAAQILQDYLETL